MDIVFFIFCCKWTLTVLGNVKRQTCTNFLRPNCTKTAKQLKMVHVIHNYLSHANLVNLWKQNFCSIPQHGLCEFCFNLPTFFQRKLLRYLFELSAVFKSAALFELMAFESFHANQYHFLSSRLLPLFRFEWVFFKQISPPFLWSRYGKLVDLLSSILVQIKAQKYTDEFNSSVYFCSP